LRTSSVDRWGVPLQSENPLAVPLFDRAVAELVSLSGDPLSVAENAVGADRGLILGHILRSYLLLYRTSADGTTPASRILADLEGLPPMDEREMLHWRAARAWASGEWVDATRSLERALLHDPRDLLALKVAQDLYFFLGQTSDLCDVVARVSGSWRRTDPDWGYVQGMYAFGLEENARYREAEKLARVALEANSRDVWATHALAHVFEMEGRTAEGIEFLTRSTDQWRSSYFAIHNWWHLALYYLERAEFEEVLALYDGPIRGTGSGEWLDVVDAASLLWRLSLAGIEVSRRAERLSLDIEPLLGEPVYVFNDWHAVMVFTLAGRDDLAERVVVASRRSKGTNRLVTGKVGLTLLEGFRSFGAGRWGDTVDLLARALPSTGAVGGSHAQRDVINLTLIVAAARSGQSEYAKELVATRRKHKAAASDAGAWLLRNAL
jgi:tetratricopeptide (TPR) repeat protein